MSAVGFTLCSDDLVHGFVEANDGFADKPLCSTQAALTQVRKAEDSDHVCMKCFVEGMVVLGIPRELAERAAAEVESQYE